MRSNPFLYRRYLALFIYFFALPFCFEFTNNGFTYNVLYGFFIVCFAKWNYLCYLWFIKYDFFALRKIPTLNLCSSLLVALQIGYKSRIVTDSFKNLARIVGQAKILTVLNMSQIHAIIISYLRVFVN